MNIYNRQKGLMMPGTQLINRQALADFTSRHTQRFQAKIPKSRALFTQAKTVMLSGVPAAWMNAFYPGTAVYVAKGNGCHFEDVDGNRFLDMSQCDLSMVCGFGPSAVADAVDQQFRQGSHFLLPVENAIVTSRLLGERFNLSYWQYTLSASSANAEAIRISRYVTGRDKVLIFGGKYHGHIDEVLVSSRDGVMTPDQLGLPKHVTDGTVVIPFNDVYALEQQLKTNEIACVLTEPVLTNMGVVYPALDFHSQLRDLTRQNGSLLIIDETHTQATCYGGFTRLWKLSPDILTIGKSVGGGVPMGAYGLSTEVAALVEDSQTTEADGRQNIALGGTMYGNALSMAAARAALEHVLTPSSYLRVQGLTELLAYGMQKAIDDYELPWTLFRLGNRSGICLQKNLPHNAAEAALCIDRDFNYAVRAFMANKGIWEPIFVHSPTVSFAHNEADILIYIDAFNQLLESLFSSRVLHH